jgi:eukaryotic-like serine/threonine-protein kinase
MSLAPGSKLGPYEITALLGAGGMGEVYRAKDTRLDRTVAIKILPAHLSSDPVRKQRFEREAKTISSLNHPHICVLYDVGSQDGVDYLVMECVEGETLAKRLEKGALPLEQVLKYGMQIADALDKAYRGGVVHRDLKPGNIMLTPSGAKLLDFGLAKPAAPPISDATLSAATAQNSPMTAEGTVVGTFQYMSPEQVEGKESDGRSDIFSFGAVLYEMLTGQKAFQGKSQLSVASAILERDPPPIGTLKPLTPPALDHTIRQCLAKNPEERWQSARDLSLAFKWVGESGSQAGMPTALARSAIRERFAWAATAILLCAVAVLGASYWRHSPARPAVIRSAILPPADAQFYALDIDAGSPAISPDGKQLVSAVRDNKGRVALWLRALDNSGEGRLLPGTEGGGQPFWAPDSNAIGFFASGKLKRINIDGNSLQTLCDASRGRGGAWNVDGVILFTPTTSSGLYQISASGGTPTAVTQLDKSHGENSHRWPKFLPDGRHFLFFLRSFQTDLSGIYVTALGSKEYRLLIKTPFGAAFVPGGSILYMQNETLFVQAFDPRELTIRDEPIPLQERVAVNSGTSTALFTVSSNGMMAYYPAGRVVGPYQLVWYGRDGKSGTPLATGFFYGPILSPDGSHALVPMLAADGLTSDVWSYDLVRGTKTRITSGPGFKNGAAWQADGQTVFFSTGLGDASHIYRVKSDGTGTPEEVLQSDGAVSQPSSVCRDGQHLAYVHSVTGESPTSIWILPLARDRQPFPLLQSQSSQEGPAFSPDCKWVAYRSNESGQPEVFVTRFPDAARKYLVSIEGGRYPHWRGDGKELFYYSPKRESLMAVNVEEKGQELVLGAPHALFSVPAGPSLGNLYDVTSDGRRFLFFRPNSSSDDVPLTLVTNWDVELKKK